MALILGNIDLAGLLLAIVSLIMTTKLVLRTERSLDKAAKCLAAFSVILVLSNLASLNDFFGGIISDNINLIIFHSSRVLSLVCFISAMRYLIKITEKK
ncbi:MAG TPA: hypothetical protein DEA43_03045 [Candidatus Moranbacteria bacterium]|nr:hypothetical protein [Candidatus Moranbacteria bacterium]HBT45832.1 hypothetical protein [Candidatus Moranbacteria bacterium]